MGGSIRGPSTDPSAKALKSLELVLAAVLAEGLEQLLVVGLLPLN